MDAFAGYLEASIDTRRRRTAQPGTDRPAPAQPRGIRKRRARSAGARRRRDALLPADDSAYGFDNIADVLGVSPALMERYLSAAWKVSSLAVGNPKITPTVETFRVRSDLSQDDHIEGLPIGTRGGILVRYTFPVDGDTSSSRSCTARR